MLVTESRLLNIGCENHLAYEYGPDGKPIKVGGKRIERSERSAENLVERICPSCPVRPETRPPDKLFDVFNKYLACKEFGCLPRAGGYDDQDPLEMAIFYMIAEEISEHGKSDRRS